MLPSDIPFHVNRKIGADVEQLLDHLGILTTEELIEVILQPSIYEEIRQRAERVAGLEHQIATGDYVQHPFNDLQLLHDTVCFIKYSKGIVRRRRMSTILCDYFQNPAYFEYYAGPLLTELGLIEYREDGDVFVLTEKSSKLQDEPYFIPDKEYGYIYRDDTLSQ